jgi:hypothetical protein
LCRTPIHLFLAMPSLFSKFFAPPVPDDDPLAFGHLPRLDVRASETREKEEFGGEAAFNDEGFVDGTDSTSPAPTLAYGGEASTRLQRPGDEDAAGLVYILPHFPGENAEIDALRRDIERNASPSLSLLLIILSPLDILPHLTHFLTHCLTLHIRFHMRGLPAPRRGR